MVKGDWLKTDPRCAKTDPASTAEPPYFPLCPIMKLNVRTGSLGGSTEQALKDDRRSLALLRMSSVANDVAALRYLNERSADQRKDVAAFIGEAPASTTTMSPG